MTERFDRGMERIRELYGGFGAAFFEDLDKVAPDFGRFIAEFSYGGCIYAALVWTRGSGKLLSLVR